MAYEGLAWSPSTPGATNNNDGDQAYNMGIKFGLVTAAANCVGVRWRVPDSVVNPQGFSHNASLWTVIGETRLANVDFTPVPGGDMDILFPTPVALSLATEYVVAVYTNHYVFQAPSPNGGWHVYSPSGNTDAYEAKLAAYNSGPNVYPASNFNGWYYVGPLMEVGGGALPGASPSGLAIPVSLGQPAAGLVATAPSGLAIPVAIGQPSVSLARVASPSGLAIPVAIGQPSVLPQVATEAPGRIIVASGSSVRTVVATSAGGQIITSSPCGQAVTS